MRKILKKIIPFILVLCILFLSVSFCYVETYALTPIEQIAQSYALGKVIESWEDPNKSILEKIEDTLHHGTFGFIPGPDFWNRPTPLEMTQQELDKKVAEDTGKDQSEVTEEDRKQWFNSNVTITDTSIKTSNNFNNYYKTIVNKYIESTGFYYLYTADIRKSVLSWSNGVQYNGIKRIVDQHFPISYHLEFYIL